MANTNDDKDDLSDDLLYQFASNIDDGHVSDHQINATQTEYITIDDDTAVEEQRLSQKLSQLSASDQENRPLTTSKKRLPLQSSPTTATTVTWKKIKVDPAENEEDLIDITIPNYLSLDNKAFKEMIQSILSNTANSYNIKDLQEIACLIHQITTLDLQKLLWNTYLRAGTSRIDRSGYSNIRIELFIWPLELKQTMLKNKATTVTDTKEIDNDTCLNYVYRILGKIVDRTTHYQTKLEEKKSRLENFFTSEMEDTISHFIEQQEIPFKIQTERKVALIEYDYKDQLFELEFNRFKPSPNQIGLFKHLTRLKQEAETSKYDVALLKQRLTYNCLPESLATLQLPLPLPPSSIDTIQDKTNRQNLFDRYTKIVQQTKSDMMSLYIAVAEVKLSECQSKYEKDLKFMRSDARSMPIYLRLSESMVDLLEQRFRNMEQRFEYLYNLKIRVLQVQAKNK